MHYHAYSFRGQGDLLKQFDPARTIGGIGFEGSNLPPESTRGWLHRPRRPSRTWDDPADAVDWLHDSYTGALPSRAHPELNTQAPSVDTMADGAVKRLSSGNDVVWSMWLVGGVYWEVAVICCPHRDGAVRCPVGRDDRR